MQKVVRVKGPRKKKRKGQRKNLEWAIAKKEKTKSKFWLMRVRQIKTLYILYLIAGKSIFSVKKLLSQQN